MHMFCALLCFVDQFYPYTLGSLEVRAAMMLSLLLLTARQIVMMTTCNTASDDKFGIMKTVSFQTLSHWHKGNYAIAPVPVRQPWRTWVNVSKEFTRTDDITPKKKKKKAQQNNVNISWHRMYNWDFKLIFTKSTTVVWTCGILTDNQALK